jgi:putative membrane protein
MAFNQGFYNLFLADPRRHRRRPLRHRRHRGGCGSRLRRRRLDDRGVARAAAVQPRQGAAALKQGVIPTLGVVALAIGLLI